MKGRINLLILALTTTLSSLYSQDCNLLPDTIFHCGFETEVILDSIGGNWDFPCDASKGGVAITEMETSYHLQFSTCGTYEATYSFNGCDSETIVFLIDDPSYTAYELDGNNDFGYVSVGCPSGGSSCDNVVSVSGGSDPLDPLWDICKTFSCTFDHVLSTEFPGNDSNCVVDSIAYDLLSGFSESDSCWTVNQDEFVTIDPLTGEIISNEFFDFMDSLGNILFDVGACPAASSCNFIDTTCIDSITIDTVLIPFPIHVGGQWTIIESGDTIVCADTTAFTKDGQDLLLVIEPGANYFGPGSITFTLLEVVAQDTLPVSQELSITAWWKENYIYDTLEIIDTNVHYSDEPNCQSCGGNSFSSNYGDIPSAPDQPCSPITLSFGDPCACGSFNAVVTGNPFINCDDPCITLSAEPGNAGEVWSNPTWFLNGGFVGSEEVVTVCDPGFYTFTTETEPNGCPVEGAFFVEEEILPVPNLEIGLISCFNPCELISTGLENDASVSLLFIYPDGSSSSEALPVCEAGTIEVQVISNFSGCVEIYSIEVDEDPVTYDVFINDPGPLTCSEPCVELIAEVSPFDVSMEFLWSGPNGFFESNQVIEICEPGSYEVAVLLNGCEVFNSVQIVESFTPITVNVNGSACFGGCFPFLGIDYCTTGIYEIPGECDSIYLLNLEILPQEEVSIFEQICQGETTVIYGTEYDSAIETQFTTIEDGCEILVDLVVDVFEYDINLNGEFYVSCDKPETTIEASSSNGISQFEWYTLSGELVGMGQFLVVEEPGIYECHNSSVNSACIAILPFEVEDYTLVPSIDVGGPYTLDCSGVVILEVEVMSDFALTYNWNGPGINQGNQQDEQPLVNEAGVYFLEVADEYGCINSVEVFVDVITALQYEVITSPSCGSDDSGLVELDLTSGGSGFYEFRLNGGEWRQTALFENLAANEYLLEIRESNECIEQRIVDVALVEYIKPRWDEAVALGADLCSTSSGLVRVAFDQGVDQMSSWEFAWSDGFSSIERNIENAGNYTLSIETECESKSYDFNITNSQIEDQSIVYVPNIFTPNADGVNDVFYCSSPYDLENYDIQIYDRWGSEIFRSASIDESWSGTINGRVSNSNSYSYKLEYDLEVCSGKIETFTKYGTIVILK